MVSPDEVHETPERRTILLLIGFVALVAIGVVTVLQPELEDEPEEDTAAEVEPLGGDEAETGLQE
ncbi:MAG: hypothetical protein ACN4G0_02260 [Polyangiales bacterium]